MLLWMIAGACPASAQFASLRGFVTDATTGEPLELVNVVLRNASGAVRGGSSTVDGLYQVARLEPGQYVLSISFIGFTTHTDTLVFERGQNRTYNVVLEPATLEGGEVVVEAEGATGATSIIAGQQIIRPADIARVPTPDVIGDLASYLSTLPATVAVGDRGGQVFIRGGEPSQNMVLVDGIMVYQPFHIVGFYSAFPSSIISRTDLYAGGFGARHGARLSSVIEVTTRNGNQQRFNGEVALSPFMSSVQAEGPIVRNRVSILASVRESLVEQAVAEYIDRPMPFSFGDAFAKVHAVLSTNSRASVTALRTHDRGRLAEGRDGVAAEQVRWTNEAVGVRYLFLPSVVPILVDVHASYSRLNNELGPSNLPTRRSEITHRFFSIESQYYGDRIDVEAGSKVWGTNLSSDLGGIYQDFEFRRSRVYNWASYLDFDFDVGGGLHLRPSMRWQFYSVRFKPFWEPRLRAEWRRGIHQVSAATGLYQQEIVGITDRRDAASVFTVWSKVPSENVTTDLPVRGRPQRAIHAIVGYRASLSERLHVAAEGFHKRIIDLFVPEWTAFPRLWTRLQYGTGTVWGFDARFEYQHPHWYVNVNYGLSSTRYRAEEDIIELWYGTESLRYRPPHDRRHQVNVVATTKIRGFDVQVRWEFGSGLPFSRVVGFDGFALIDDIVHPAQVEGTQRVIYERPYQGILPTYHRLDVSIERRFALAQSYLTVQASAINTYDRANLFYLDIFTLQRVDQLPLVPALGLKLETR